MWRSKEEGGGGGRGEKEGGGGEMSRVDQGRGVKKSGRGYVNLKLVLVFLVLDRSCWVQTQE